MQTRAKNEVAGRAWADGDAMPATSGSPGLSVDSRDVEDGHLFCALAGHAGPRRRVHSICNSHERGRGADRSRRRVHWPQDVLAESGVPLVVVEDPREALALYRRTLV